jgi:CRP-like cAMP-binding protein
MGLIQETEALRKLSMFSKLDGSKLKLLAFTSQLLSFDAGEELCHVGDVADCAYVIISGVVEILAQTEAGEVVALTRGENELIGEMAILMGEPRSATMRAREHVSAMRITGEMFLKLLSENPQVSLDVMRQLSIKLAQAHQQFERVQDKLQKYEAPG